MNVLVTGAAGFVGSHLVDLLLAEKIPARNLRLFVLESDSLKNLPSGNFEIIKADIRDKKAVKQAMKDVDVVYHLAAITLDGNTNTDYNGINIIGTQNLLDECRDTNIKKFILFSSTAVFGLPAYLGDMVDIDETSPKNPMEVYGKSKLEAERRVIETHEKSGLPYAIIRPATVYGPRDIINLLELYRTIKKHLFFFIGDGKNKMDCVFVKDVVKGARLAELSSKKDGDYIIGGERPLTLNEIVANVSKSININILPIHIPKSLGLALSYLTKYGAGIIGMRSPLFPDRVRVMTSNCYFNISKAKKELGYIPKTSFEEGTKITGKWLIENKML